MRKRHPVWLRLQPRKIHAVRSESVAWRNFRKLFMDDPREHPRPHGTAVPTRMLSVDRAEAASDVAAAAAAEKPSFPGPAAAKLKG